MLLYVTHLCKFSQEGKLFCVAFDLYFKYCHSLNATSLQGAQSLNILNPKKEQIVFSLRSSVFDELGMRLNDH